MKKDKEKKISVFKRMLPYAGKKGFMINFAMLLSALSGLSVLMPMVFIHKIISSVIMNGLAELDYVKHNALMASAFAVLGLLLYVGALIVSHIFAFEIEHNIIKSSMKKMLEMPLGFFANRESGKIRKVIVDGAAETHSFLAHQLPDLAANIVTPLVLLVFFFIFDWKLGLVSLLPVALSMYFLMSMMTEVSKKMRDEYYSSMAAMSSEIVEYVRGIPVVKTFAQSLESFEKFHKLILFIQKNVTEMSLSWKNRMSLFEATASSTSFFIVPFVILMIQNGMDVRSALANSIIYLLIGPTFAMTIMRNANLTHYTYFAERALDNIDNILDYKPLSYGEKAPSNPDIEFKNVSFAYDGDKVLDDISFSINKGEHVAIVGASGGGKTTIARLAARFYDCSEGEILIGNENIKNFSREALMKKLAFVFQNSKLFKMSLRENLLLANESASDEDINNALEASGAKEIIDNLEQGLDTVFGTKGTYFSGGEIQRLALARAFLKNADIIILDEATAFADPENEQIIQEAFKKLCKNKTSLMIAHRLSTVVNADKIIVLNRGKIVEVGRHDELIAKQGTYSELWKEYQKAIQWRIGGRQ